MAVQAMSTVGDTLQRAFEYSRVSGLTSRVRTGSKTALTSSFLYRTVTGFETAFRSSWLYHWLTSEPDTDVIVVDLRETLILGPLLAWLDSAITIIYPYAKSARSRKAAAQFAMEFERKPVRVASLVTLTVIVTVLVVKISLGTLDQTTLGYGLIGCALALAGTRSRRSWQDITGTRTYELLQSLLEPPEQPDERRKQ